MSSISMLPAPPLYSPLRKVPKAKVTSPTTATSKIPSSPLLYSTGGGGGRGGNGVAVAAAAVARARLSSSLISSPCTTPLSQATTKRKLSFSASSASPSPSSPYSSIMAYTISSSSRTSILVLVVTLSVLSIALVSMQVSTIDQMQIRNKLKNRHAGVTGVGVNRLRAVAVVEEQEEEDVQLQSPPPPQSSSSSFSSKTVVQQLKDDQRKELLALQKQIKNLQERINELYGPEDSRDVEEDKKEEVEATARDTTNIDTNTSSSAAKESSFQQQRQQALDDDLDVSTEALRTQHGYTSPACTLQFDDYIDNDIGEEDDDLPVFDRIFFLHMRKAGGSSIRDYFKWVHRTHNITVEFSEGKHHPEKPLSHEEFRYRQKQSKKHENDHGDGDHDHDGSIQTIINQDDKNWNGRTLYVTTIREPISRTISHYKYEHRWDCKEQLHNESFVPSASNVMMNFTTFITANYQPPNKKKKMYWDCAANCISKWITGYHPYQIERIHKEAKKHNPNLNYNYTDTLVDVDLDDEYMYNLETKSHDLFYDGYHLVIVMEWLKDERYVESLERLFGGVTGLSKRNDYMLCYRPTKMANELVPLNITEEDREILKKNNQVDTKIYSELTSCGGNANVDGSGGLPSLFQNRKPFRFVSPSNPTINM